MANGIDGMSDRKPLHLLPAAPHNKWFVQDAVMQGLNLGQRPPVTPHLKIPSTPLDSGRTAAWRNQIKDPTGLVLDVDTLLSHAHLCVKIESCTTI